MVGGWLGEWVSGWVGGWVGLRPSNVSTSGLVGLGRFGGVVPGLGCAWKIGVPHRCRSAFNYFCTTIYVTGDNVVSRVLSRGILLTKPL